MLTEGAIVDRYEIGPEIGRGGMGRVHRGRDTRLARDVAVKIVEVEDEQKEEARRRLMREARAAAALDHPSAVQIFDVGEHEGTPYIVMELVEGDTLRAAMGSPAVTRDRMLGWLLEVARVLALAHDKGLIHRDIKPENVMLRADGAIRVLDFGIARRRRRPVDEAGPTESLVFATITEVGMPVGTPLYMSPEQIRGGEIDGRSDQFAWGVMAYEMLARRPPWAMGDSLQLVAAILTEEPPSLVDAGVEPAIAAVVHRTLAKEREARFRTTHELVAALEAALGEGVAPAPVMPAPPIVVRGDLRGYSAPEVSEILERALLAQPPTDEGLEAADLLDLARQMGVGPRELDEVADDLSDVRSPRALKESAWRGFKGHAAIWLAVSTFLFLINMLTSASYPWFLFPFLSWGLAVAIHGITMRLSGPPQPRKRKLRRLMKKLGGERVRSGLALEPAVRQVLDAARTSVHPTVATPVPPMDQQLSWDARYAARRIDSQIARKDGPRIEVTASIGEQEAVAEALAEQEATMPAARARHQAGED